MKDTEKIIHQTIETLKSGGLVVFPTDTVYGLLVDATNEKAVEKLIAFKNRPPGKAISVFINEAMINDYVEVSEKSSKLLQQLLPGPFTIILPSKHKTSQLLESEKGTLGVRIPDNELISELVKAYGKPITATSANLGGQSSHYSVESLLHHISKEKHSLIDLIIDGGQLPRNKPSTVVDLSQQEMKVIRQGDILLGDVKTIITKNADETKDLGTKFAQEFLQKEQGKPIVFILVGDLGSGKTMFTKGIAEYVKAEKVISPTFVIYYEYDINQNGYKKLIHGDLYNVEEEEEFDHLGLENYLKDGTVMVIEWGEKLGDLYEKFKEKAKVVYISINYIDEESREIKVSL